MEAPCSRRSAAPSHGTHLRSGLPLMSRSRIPRGFRPLLHFVVPAAMALATPALALAQQSHPLSLADAVRLAHASSEALVVARSAIDDAGADRIRANGMKRMRLQAWSSVD